ncbi:MAG: hypothetical protein SFZ23_15925 [Planctomycetota bacterium]|nr:hypothetical protein [Planctomycetota bacterium]
MTGDCFGARAREYMAALVVVALTMVSADPAMSESGARMLAAAAVDEGLVSAAARVATASTRVSVAAARSAAPPPMECPHRP